MVMTALFKKKSYYNMYYSNYFKNKIGSTLLFMLSPVNMWSVPIRCVESILSVAALSYLRHVTAIHFTIISYLNNIYIYSLMSLNGLSDHKDPV